MRTRGSGLTKTLIASALALGALVPAAAQAARDGFYDGGLTLYAGPGHRYPEIMSRPGDGRVLIYGCARDFRWCDVSRGRFRGWADADELQIETRRGIRTVSEVGPRPDLPLIRFTFDTYWNDNYRNRDFYANRARWRDMDRDGIPNRFDRDRDGDGIRNSRDAMPNAPNADRRDRDRDGVPNQYDRDRDNDGVPNRWDDAPNNQWRN